MAKVKFLDDFLRGFMELHIIFFILAGLLILVLVGSSILSNRREKSRVFSSTFSQRPPSTPIHSQPNQPDMAFEPQTSHSPETMVQPEVETQSSAEIERDVANSLNEIKIRIPGQEENNAAPEFARAEQAPIYGQPQQAPASPYSQYNQPASEQPIFINTAETAQHYQNGYVAENYAENYEQNYSEPVYAENTQVPVEETPAQPESEAPVDMITLYVVAAEGYQFEGEHVVQCLEALGFEYGEYQIFHRHKHLGNNTSPVIFSVANMMQPGIFDLENIKSFSTVGLVIFMHLPTDGNAQTNLRLMLQSSERLASALNGFVLNDRREIFDENSRIEYLKRVS